jgi:hypothetical protein
MPGLKVKAVQDAGISRFVVRGAKNSAARRNSLPSYKGRGRRCVQGQRIMLPKAGLSLPRAGALAPCLDLHYNLVQQSYPFCTDGKERSVSAVQRARSEHPFT